MKIIHTIKQMRIWHEEERLKGKRIAFVPTMGYLHEGHLSLVQVAKQDNDSVVMSIFVNPLQFGPSEDYGAYPRDIKRDTQLAEEAGVAALFLPEVLEMYPYYPQLTTIEVQEVSEVLCGASRPGHFTGVTTIVAKLFNIVRPDTAYFGQKDYQQVRVIKQMVQDLNMPLEIISVPIKREKDGLAMSSRNTYLSEEERKEAICLSEALCICRDNHDKGEKNAENLIRYMVQRINKEPSAVIDYIEICDAETLKPLSYVQRQAVVALAVKIGRTRLIDNIIIGGRA
ncbi:MAG: pantoate--beta-alanine ligase [Firmicutes bacterium HGW-Firmicutes-12]|nr:MAG: pantoate--beta-alanine ligase [Firmicutes bacterium HGW-Firmicutes-12]